MTEKPRQTFFKYFPVSVRDLKWGIHVTTAGQSHIGQGSPYPAEGHLKDYLFGENDRRTLSEFQLIYIAGGRGWFESQLTPMRRVESGTAFLLFPGIWHRYRPDPATGWTEHWVGFNGDIPLRLVKNGFFQTKKPVFKIQHETDFMTVFEGIIAAIKCQRAGLQQVISASATHLLALLYSERQSKEAGTNKVSGAIQLAIKRMTDKLTADIDLKKLAQELNVSYTWFRRSFREHTGLSPHQYLLQLRVAHARTLLSSTLLPVKEISARTGFENEHYFCRLFKMKTGVTPTDWRANSQN